MKKTILALIILLLSANSFSQISHYPLPGSGEFNGGLGLNWIDGKLHYAVHLTPEFTFDKIGVGLDLQLNFNQEGKLRTEDFNEFSDYVSVIRYLRYGEKGDPAYIKLGALDYYTLGHGSIMYNYFNSPIYDSRKAGLVFDVSFSKFGVESIYSSFGEAGIIGARVFLRPFQFTSQESIPIIGQLEIGATVTGDFHDEAGVIAGTYSLPNKIFTPTIDEGPIKIIGLDIGLPVISTNNFNLTLYADYSKIINFGSGVATGFLFNVKNLGLLKLSGKFERRFNGEHYLPSYFNALYEIERFSLNATKGSLKSKASLLTVRNASDNGVFGELGADIAGLFYVKGSYQRLDKTPNSGILHFRTQINPEDGSFVIRAGYDKINIGNETSIFKLDDNSLFYFEYGYKVAKYVLVSMLYSWTYTPIRSSNDEIIDYVTQKRIEPRISFIIPL